MLVAMLLLTIRWMDRQTGWTNQWNSFSYFIYFLFSTDRVNQQEDIKG